MGHRTSVQRGVAQLGSASALGAEGRRFKSCHPDQPRPQRRGFFHTIPGESMPSYRTIMTVTTLAPGRAPEEVEAAARSVTRLESWDIAIASGQPRVTARFTATDDAEARVTHREITAAVRLVAEVPRARLAAVVRGRSHFLAP